MQKIFFRHLIKIFLAVSSLTTGGLIYIIYRPTTLNMFSWFDYLGLSPFIRNLRDIDKCFIPNDFILFSFPDGLWITSYLIIVNNVIPHFRKKELLFWIILLPVLSIISEFAQWANLIQGTYDINDIICYILPLFINLIFLRHEEIF